MPHSELSINSLVCWASRCQHRLLLCVKSLMPDVQYVPCARGWGPWLLCQASSAPETQNMAPRTSAPLPVPWGQEVSGDHGRCKQGCIVLGQEGAGREEDEPQTALGSS